METIYFSVIDRDGGNMGVFAYNGDNRKADSLLMQMVCDRYCADDCSLDTGFKHEAILFKVLKLSGTYIVDEEETETFEIGIEQVGIYGLTEA